MTCELQFSCDYGTLAAQSFGAADGLPTLALHGWLDNSATFHRIAPYWPSLNLVALDLPGHGKSSHRPPGAAYPYLDYLPDLDAVIDQLRWERFTIIGHSLGGALGAAIAALRPERVEKLVLLEALGPMTGNEEDLPQRVTQFLDEKKKLKSKKLPVYTDAAQAASVRQKVGDLTREAADTLATRGLRAIEGGVTWATDPRLRLPTPQLLTGPQVVAMLSRIQCPTLLVRAENGIAIAERKAKAQTEAIAQLHVERVAGFHHVHLDHPERVAPLVARFLGI